MRLINELIWHCTATPAGRETSVAEIDSWHKARGWKGIGYHKVVHLDGSVSDGRPESQIGAHVEGHNANTIGYVYVGGVDANDVAKARDTRTPSQKRAMERLTRDAIARYGLTKVSGHRDYDPRKACPCFDARAEYAHLLRPAAPPFEPAPPAEPADKLGLLRRIRNWVVGGTSGVGGLGFLAYLTDWQVVAILCAFAFLLIACGVAFVIWFFGADKVRAWVRKQVA